MHIVAAPDKFRGSATAAEVAAGIGQAAEELGATCSRLPLADGGEGTLEAFGGPNRWTEVTGPLGAAVRAGWRLDEAGRAVVEMACASGLVVAGGKARNNALDATTRGTGELIAAAIRAGARRIIVGVGGSATTDGGLGAVEALADLAPLGGPNAEAEVIVCCDVRTPFARAAKVFGPQKGATPGEVDELTLRLERLQDHYENRYGVPVANLPGAGAAGGLAGGLAALGARLVPGFPLIAKEVGLRDALVGADMVITGEGLLDAGSFDGKVVGGVAALARESGISVLAVVGAIDPEVRDRIPSIALLDHFGETESWQSTVECVRLATTSWLAERPLG